MVDKFVIGRTLQSVVNMERTGGTNCVRLLSRSRLRSRYDLLGV